MSTPLVSPASQTPHRKPSNIGKVALIVGTAYSVLAEYIRMLEVDVAVVSDVQGELDLLPIDPAYADRIHFIPVGRGHTLHTLFSGATPAERAVIDDLPGSSARHGLSRIRVAGGVAYTSITGGDEFARLVHQQVIPQLMFQVGGACDDIQLDIYVGTSGGTGSRGGIIAGRALVSALLAVTDANIDVHVHIIGAVTFNSPGFDRCPENAAPALVDWLDFARRVFDPRVSVVLHLSELTPVGIDKSRRDQLTIDGIQAALAPALYREHFLKASNATFSGEFGNVRLVRSGHYRPLPPARAAADAADKYLPHVTRALATRPDLGRVKSLDWFLDTEPLASESASGLFDRVRFADVDDLLNSAQTPAARIEAAARVRLKDGRTLDLADVAATFATPLATVRETCERICLLKTARSLMSTERRELRHQVADLEAQLALAARRLRAAILDAQGATWRSLLISDDTKARRLMTTITHVRALVAELNEAQAKLVAADRTFIALRDLLRQLVAKLNRLRKKLRRCQPHGDARRLPPAIVPVPIDDLWKRLLEFAEDPTAAIDRLQKLLAEAVRFVLPEGLASIVGAADSSFDAIVRAATANTYRELSPAWGGHERDEPGSNWLVYPPVDERTAKALLEHHAASHGKPPQIGIARTALGSINVVSLEIRYCQQRDDAWTQFYQKAYARARASKRFGFYICEPETAVRLGIEPSPNGNGKHTKPSP